MFKKIINILLAVLLCISLVACSETPAKSDGTQQSTEQGIQTENSKDEQVAAIVVHIAINPEFKIHVGNDGNVFDVECLNDDAKVVNDKVSVTGKPCKDAIVLILSETVRQGFLKDDGEIEISVSIANEISNQMDTWNNAVMDAVTQALDENKLNAAIVFGADNWEPPKEENSNSSAPVPPENKDENISDDNSSNETDANGNTIIKGEDGSITIVDKNGNMIQVIYVDYNGEVVTQNYDENGNFVSEEREPLGKLEWFAGETIVHTNNAGDKTTITFGENGQLKFYRQEFSDGNLFERYYYENGALLREYDLHKDSTYVDISYDINGNRTTENAKYADSSLWELTYNSDGSYYGYTYYPDGSVWYNEWDANHNQNLDAQKRIK